MAKKTKANLEFLLVKAELKGIPEKGLLRSHNIGQVDLICLLTNKLTDAFAICCRHTVEISS